MLGGRISNQDEDEVEDELEALEAEVRERERLPDPPTKNPREKAELPDAPTTVPVKERAKARQKEQEQRTAMLA